MIAWGAFLQPALITEIKEAKQNKRRRLKYTGTGVNMKSKIQPLM